MIKRTSISAAHSAARTAPSMVTIWLPLGCLLLLVLFPLVAPALDLGFYVSFVRRVLIYALAASSLNFILGYGGMVALGHAAFLGLAPTWWRCYLRKVKVRQ